MKMVTKVESFVKALKDLIVERKSSIPILQFAVVAWNQLKSTDLDHWTLVDFEGEWDGFVDGKREFLIPYFQLLNILKGEKGPMTIEYLPGVPYEVAAPNTKEHKVHECGCERRGNNSWSCGHVDKSPAPADATDTAAQESEGTPETPKTVTRYGDPSVRVTVAGVEFKLPTRPLTNYPVTPEVKATECCSIGAQEFNTLLERTKFAISREESRYTLNGALLEVKGGKARMVTTDGHRLSLAEAFEAAGELTTLIPAQTINYLERRAGKVCVIINAGEHHISATMGDVTIISRKMTGTFPNYAAVMPTKFNMQMEIPSAKSADKMLLRVAQCADERSGAVRWDFGAEHGAVISAKSTESGEAKAKLDANFTVFNAETSGEPETEQAANVLSIGMSAAYVSEFLKIAGDGPVTMSLRDGQSAALFTSGDYWKYVVMPMRI